MAFDVNQLAVIAGIALVILALVIWAIMRANRKATIIEDDSAGHDVLEEGAAPAARNQALIDAPEAAQKDMAVEAPEIAPEAEPEAAPEPAPEPKAEPAPSGDDLRQIKGLGPKLVALLAEQGITSFEQIANWSEADVARVDATLGRFAGRIERDQWVEQAKFLAAGNAEGFADKFGQNR